MTRLEPEITRALRQVIDPETGQDLLAMGLIHGIEMQGGHVTLTMTTTTRGCPLAELLRQGVEAALLSLEGVSSAEVRLVWDPPWTPDRMGVEPIWQSASPQPGAAGP
jgi:metal-sulfur cluster biosynthetic enzyme